MKPPGLPTRISSVFAFLWLLLLLALAFLTIFGLLFTPQSHGATITYGTPKELHLGIFGIASGNRPSYSGEHQQVYDGSLFKNAGLITQIAFISRTISGPVDTTYQLSLSLGVTAKTPLSAEKTFATALTPVLSGAVQVHLTALANDYDFLINLATPFYYDPALGNLVLDVVRSDVTMPPPDAREVTFWGEAKSNAMERIYICQPTNYCIRGEIYAIPNDGLVTRFTTAPVPEPGLAWLLSLGAVLTFARRWRRGAAAALVLGGLVFTSESHGGTIAVGNPTGTYFGVLGVQSKNWPTQKVEYQQIYARGAFKEACWITQVAFMSATSGKAVDVTYDLELSFGVTEKTVASKANTLATGLTPGFAGKVLARLTAAPKDYDLVVELERPFFYDPARGNLVMDLVRPDAGTQYRGSVYFCGEPGSRLMAHVARKERWGPFDGTLSDVRATPNEGLVTRFITSAVPEPGTGLLVSVGTVLTFSRRLSEGRGRV